ncbi:uncharacterized protein F4822DRAFT_443255 [Hypoxylon trugodes]|uniref:uncharacterized protein n=1 Tax=Hypoxylon trugodes TaxID=326681 RepID=UPI0021A04F03|nr:uncharacterized protein F4822DRAFT_443255 [Hypoxylon trugodes]KAI1390401.1 hypothetical protein F4822DRAFT_443255 [Hypoxylon trugodes]
MLATLAQLGKKQRAKWEKQSDATPPKEKVKFAASLYQMPAVLIKAAFTEARHWFGSELKPMIYYGDASDHNSGTSGQDSIIGSHRLEIFLEEHPDNDPETSKIVILSSYVTYKRRETIGTKKLRSQLSQEDRVFLALHLVDSNSRRGPNVEEPDEVDDFELPENQMERPEKVGRAPNEYVILRPSFPYKYLAVLCDEAHVLTNRHSSIHKTVKCLDRAHLILCTAAPIINTTIDLLAYALLMWPKAKPPKMPAGFSMNSFYGPGALLTNYTHSDVGERYLSRVTKKGVSLNTMLQDIDTYAAELQENLSSGSESTGKAPLIDPGEYPDDYDDIVLSAEAGRKPWVFNPCHMYWAHREFDDSFSESRKYGGDFLSEIAIKRGMNTQLKLPNGNITTPSDTIPAAKSVVSNIQFNEKEQELYLEIYRQMANRLFTPEPESGEKPDAARGRDLAQRRINSLVWRILLLSALDVQAVDLLLPNVKNIAFSTVFAPPNHNTGLQLLGGATPKKTAGGKQKNTATLGTDQVATLATKWDDGGASWLFETLKAGEEYSLPTRRFAYVQWVAAMSPITARVLIEVAEGMKEPIGPSGLPNRFVVMVMMPWAQQSLALALEMFGYNVISLRAGHSMAKRNRFVEKFNDPKSDVQILVISMELSAFGLNLHKSCARGIIVQWPWSANHLMQMLGRLPRIGQQRPVRWTIYTMPGTLCDRMETIIWSKYVRQPPIDGKISAHLNDTIDPLHQCQKLSVFFGDLGQKLITELKQGCGDATITLIKNLDKRTPGDLVAGAVIYARYHYDNDAYPELSWEWLSQVCMVSQLTMKLDEEWIGAFLPDTILRSLRGEEKRDRVERTKSSKAELKKLIPDATEISDEGNESERSDMDSNDSEPTSSKRKQNEEESSSRKRAKSSDETEDQEGQESQLNDD